MSGRLVLDGELLTPGPPVPERGDTFAIPISRYRVLAVREGDYPHPVVLAGHALADMRAKTFAPGARHRMELSRDFPEGSVPVNPFHAESFQIGLYFCHRLEELA
jgi:hypothetical protein